MKIFEEQPNLTKHDRDRLNKLGLTQCWNYTNKALSKCSPSTEDLKRLVLMELEREKPRAPMIEKFIVRLQKKERAQIFLNIRKTDAYFRLIPENSL